VAAVSIKEIAKLLNINPRNLTPAPLYWASDGDCWVLRLGKRKFGRVFRDDRFPTMWRSLRADSRLSDMASLSWAKSAILEVAERELSYAESQQIGALFEGTSPLVRFPDGGE
jgi:hypothetical protein